VRPPSDENTHGSSFLELIVEKVNLVIVEEQENSERKYWRNQSGVVAQSGCDVLILDSNVH
jgi:hypothetical protein